MGERLTAFEEAVLAAVPDNWLDSILTGPNKVLGDGPVYTCRDIERVLLAVRGRLRLVLTKQHWAARRRRTHG